MNTPSLDKLIEILRNKTLGSKDMKNAVSYTQFNIFEQTYWLMRGSRKITATQAEKTRAVRLCTDYLSKNDDASAVHIRNVITIHISEFSLALDQLAGYEKGAGSVITQDMSDVVGTYCACVVELLLLTSRGKDILSYSDVEDAAKALADEKQLDAKTAKSEYLSVLQRNRYNAPVRDIIVKSLVEIAQLLVRNIGGEIRKLH